jgi:hypothetical protein
MAGRRSVLLLTCGLLTACGDDSTSPPAGVQALEFAGISGVQGPSGRYYLGTDVLVRVRALDYAGMPAEGERLTFVPLDGTLLSASEATTGLQGTAEVGMLVVGDAFGVRIEAEGARAQPLTVSLEAEPLPEVRFDHDEVRLTAPEERFDLFAQVLDGEGELMLGSSVDFQLTRAGVVRLEGRTATGNYRGMLVAVIAEGEGATKLIATHSSGAADTAEVEVAF